MFLIRSYTHQGLKLDVRLMNQSEPAQSRYTITKPDLQSAAKTCGLEESYIANVSYSAIAQGSNNKT